MRAAELAETAAHDLPRAAALARRALEAVPGYPPAAHLLERLYSALGRWDELVKVVEIDAGTAASERPTCAARGGAGSGGEMARLERLGALYEDRLNDPGKALALYGEWADLGTRRAAALRALLRAAEKAGDALVAAEAALKLGTEIAELSADDPLRVVLSRRRDLRRARRRRRRGGAGVRGGAGAGCGVAARRWRGWRARTTAAASSIALVAVLLLQAACETNPAGASALEVEAARICAFRLGRIDEALAAATRALA